jgi:cytidylate kinase
MKHIVVTIDGPAGTGKSTVAKEVAKKLGFLYLDTGALYRAAAVAIEDSGCRIDDDKNCEQVLSRTTIGLTGDRVFLNGLDVTQRIRSHHVSSLASEIAVHPHVRNALLNIQRSFRERGSLVAEGRDTGSVVFPDADIKIYLDASQEERARRRYEELVSKGSAISYEQVLNDLRERDARDTSRATAPLIIPQHAIVVDTTHLSIENVARIVLDKVRGFLAD